MVLLALSIAYLAITLKETGMILYYLTTPILITYSVTFMYAATLDLYFSYIYWRFWMEYELPTVGNESEKQEVETKNAINNN